MKIATYRDFFCLIILKNYDIVFVIVLIHLFILVTLIFRVIRVFHGFTLSLQTTFFMVTCFRHVFSNSKIIFRLHVFFYRYENVYEVVEFDELGN